MKFKSILGPVEYSDGSQLSNAVFEILIRRLDKKTPPFFEKKYKKDKLTPFLTGASLFTV